MSSPASHVPVSREFDLALGDHTLRVQFTRSPHPEADTRPTLVFLHDSLGCITVWRDVPARLAEALGCHALVYDRRGYGRSSAFAPVPRHPGYLEDEARGVREVLDRCGVADAVLFGHSDGGSIALLAAAMYPERVRAIVTEGAHVFVEERTLDGIREAKGWLASTDLRERLKRHHGALTDGVTSAWIDVWLSPAFRDWNIERYLPRITCPALVLQGADDEYGTPAQVEAIVRGIGAQATGHLIPGARHTPHRETPEVVTALVRDFWWRLPAMRGRDGLTAPYRCGTRP